MRGFHNREHYDTPEWAATLTSHYWRIRVEGRDKVKRRRYYRYVAKEKLRLAETGVSQDLIKAVCRYLVKLDIVSGVKMTQLMSRPPVQLVFDFHGDVKIFTINFT